jgi:hypothetical protein
MNLTKEEVAAIEASLPEVGAVVAEIGMDRPFADWSRDEALRLVVTCVRAYQKKLLEITEREGPPF